VSNAQYFHPIVTNFGFSRQIFLKVPVSDFTEIRPVGAAVVYVWIDGRTGRS